MRSGPMLGTLAVLVLVSSLFVASPAKAVDQATLTGHVSLGTASVSAGQGDVVVTLDKYVGASTVPLTGFSAVTDSAGNYSFSGLPNERFDVIFTYVRAGSYLAVTRPYSALFGGTTFSVVIPRAYLVSGHVSIDTAGHSAASGEVKVTATSMAGGSALATTSTDASGNYSFGRLAVNYNYYIEFSYLGSADIPHWYFTPGGIGTRDYRSAAALGMTADTVANVVVGAGPAIEGTLRTSAGVPVADMFVTALGLDTAVVGGPPYRDSFQTRTDSAGHYILRALPPEWDYNVSFGGKPSQYAFATVNGGNVFRVGSLVDVSGGAVYSGYDGVLYLRSRITGVVSGVTTGFGQAQVLLLLPDASGAWAPMSVSGVGDDGSYLFDELPPGQYKIQAGYFGTAFVPRSTSPAIVLAEGQSATHNTSMTSAARAAVPMGDFSGDGFPDVLVRDSVGSLYRYSGNGAGGWLGTTRIGTGWNGFNRVFGVGDFSGDGCADVVGRTSGGDLWLYRGNCAGGWFGASKIGVGWGAFTEVFGVGDFDNDTFPDVMARTASGDLYLYRGNGTGGWAGSTRIGTGWDGFTTVFGVGDFSGDGKPDVMARTPSGDLYLYRGNGVGGWGPSGRIGTGWGIFTAIIGASDFSGDGFADVLARTPGGDLYLYEGNGTGGWKRSSRIGTGWGPLGLVS